MPKLSPTSWQTQVKIFEGFGCVYIRQKGDSSDLSPSKC